MALFEEEETTLINYNPGQNIEANVSVSVKQHTTGKVQLQFFYSFSLVLTKFLLCKEDWALDYNSMKNWDLLNIS